MSSRGAALDSSPTASAICARLEAFTEAPGTIELFDALSVEDGRLEAVGTALRRFPNHPLALEVGAWLASMGVEVPEPDPVAELRALGIDDVRRWYERQDKERARLERALSDSQTALFAARLGANAYAMVCVLLFFAAVLGWAAAFGGWNFKPEAALPGPADTPKPTSDAAE